MIEETLIEISENFKKLSEKNIGHIQSASKIIIESLQHGGKVMFCGNGGSAADSQHLAAELTGRYRKNRAPLAAIALTTDTSAITAISNDFSFEEIFTRQISAIGKKGDILYAISTSGESKNILDAIKIAQEMNIKVIGLTGENKSKMDSICDIVIKVPANRADRIQEMHIAVGQIICQIIENSFFP